MGVKFNKRMLGIGLLELMLSLAIIAVLLIMATRYYSSASGTQKVQAAVDMVNAVKAAMGNYTAGIAAGTTGTKPSIADLVDAGYLPSTFVAGTGSTATSSTVNPWNMGISISAMDSTTFSVELVTPTAETCNAVAQKINATTATVGDATGATCPSGSGTLTAQFTRQ